MKLNLFKKKAKNLFTNSEIFSEVLLMNQHINIIADACSECYNTNTDRTYEEMKDYIERRIKTGHESILEHSNIVLYFQAPVTINLEILLEFIEVCKYLNVRGYIDKNKLHIIVAGSIRGIKHVYRNIKNINNSMLLSMSESIYDNIESCYFSDFIEDGIMKKELFNEYSPNLLEEPLFTSNEVDIINVDPISKLVDELKKRKIYGQGKFEYNDLLDMVSITFHVKEVERIISQMLTRHRCAITQASQRYIDYSKGYRFIAPCESKEMYDENKVYKIKLQNIDFELTQTQLGEMLVSIYPQLREQGLLKEDARGFLPNNISTSLYMTMTYRQYYNFEKLRTDMAAQAPVRKIANLEKDGLLFIDKHSFDKNNHKFLEPRYKLSSDYINGNSINPDEETGFFDGVDEIIEYKE